MHVLIDSIGPSKANIKPKIIAEEKLFPEMLQIDIPGSCQLKQQLVRS